MSVKVAKVTKATAIARELRSDMFVNGTSRGHEITKHENTKTRDHEHTKTRKRKPLYREFSENFRAFVFSCFPTSSHDGLSRTHESRKTRKHENSLKILCTKVFFFVFSCVRGPVFSCFRVS